MENSSSNTDMRKFFAVRTTSGREEIVIDFLFEYIKKNKSAKIYSVFLPASIKGFVFVEADNIYEVQKAIYGIPHAKGVLQKPIDFSEIEHYFIEKRKIEIKKGDIVEIIAGPFRGSKGRVIRYDDQKEELTVELVDSPIPIPITLKVDDIKILKKEEDVRKELEEKEKLLEKELEEEWLKF